MQTIERQEVREIVASISGFHDATLEKLIRYIDYLSYEEWLEEQENAEDIAAYHASKDEPSYSLEEVKRDLGIK